MNLTIQLGWWMIPAFFMPIILFVAAVKVLLNYDREAFLIGFIGGSLTLISTLLTRYL